MARKKYIERIKTDKHTLDFYVLPDGSGMVVEYTDNLRRYTNIYRYQPNTQDWVSAIKLVNLLRKTIKESEA